MFQQIRGMQPYGGGCGLYEESERDVIRGVLEKDPLIPRLMCHHPHTHCSGTICAQLLLMLHGGRSQAFICVAFVNKMY